MNPSHQLEISPDLVADARRALFIRSLHTLVIADVHLGFAWVQRHRGQLLPVNAPDSTFIRLQQLAVDYAPRRLVVAGDLVHRAASLPQVEQALREFISVLPHCCGISVLEGNHDCGLQKWLTRWKLHQHLDLLPDLRAHGYYVHHGHQPLLPAGPPAVTIIGHEHPALRLTDAVTTSVKVPCFLVAPHLIVLPAFSDWASGMPLGSQPFLGEAARHTHFSRAIAILGSRLLSCPLPGGACEDGRFRYG